MGRIGRGLSVAVTATGLALGGSLAGSQAIAASKPLVGDRVAGHRPLRSFAAGPTHLRGPRPAVPGKIRPIRPVRPTPDERAESAAMKRAIKTGRPVLVTAETTPTVAVKAHPNGLLSMTSNVYPVRVRVHGGWRSINPRLRRTAAGTWSPSVASVPVTFSGGGSASPLVRVAGPGGQSVAMYWPGVLPRPAIAGTVAEYKNVLPGVDLRMKATGIGYLETLVVRDAAAAAEPRLRSLTFRLRAGRGLALRRGPRGSLAIVGAKTGKLAFAVGQPQVWDSRGGRHGSLSAPALLPATADSAGSGPVTSVPASYRLAGPAAATIAMMPPARALIGKNVRYPVYIDPEIAPATDYYAQVMQTNNGADTQEWDTTSGTTSQSGGITEIGDCGYSNCFWVNGSGTQFLGYTDRDYFRFATTNLEKRNGQSATVYMVTFDDEQTYNSQSCTSEASAVYSTTGGISSTTTWGGPQGSQLATASSNAGGGTSCPAANVDFSSSASGNSALKTALQTVATDGDSTVTLELRAASETTDTQYKRYKDNPTLTVYYNFAPLAPTGLSVQNQVTCDSSVTYTGLTKPKLFATGTDNNPSPLQVKLNYTLQTSGGTAAGGTLPSPVGASGAQQSTTPSTALISGTAYKFDVTATNVPTDSESAARTGPASAFYPFSVLTPSAALPAITSADYPQGQWGQPAGAPGVFTVRTNGASNIAGFAYSFDGGAGSEPAPTTTDCGYRADGGLGTSVDSNGDGGGSTSGELSLVDGSTAQIQIRSGITSGQHTLYVVSFDKAHNISGESAYTFYVPQNYQSTSQPVTFINGSTLAVGATGANASLVTTQANCCTVSWRGGSQLVFNATATGQTFTVTFSVPTAGFWQLGGSLTQGPGYGQDRIDLDQATSDVNLAGTATVPWDSYAQFVSMGFADLGTQFLTAGSHTLTFTVTGENASSAGFKAGINYLTLSPTSRQEAESLTTGTPSAGTLAPQYQAGSPWSENGQLKLTNTTVGSHFTVSFTAPVESDYALGVNLTTGPDYGSLRFDLDPATSNVNLAGTAASPLDGYSASLSATYVFLGGVHLTAGTHVLQVTVAGADPSSTGDNAGLDFVEAVPVTGASESSFTAAMNNLGIASDGAASFAGGFDLKDAPSGKNLSLQAMQAAGITPGTATAAGATFTMDGATFTMPQLETTGGTVVADNVIPDGQTIPLPAVKATDVALLVANTCGTPSGSPALKATLHYGNGGASQPLVASVPDWSLPRGYAAVALSHWDVGTTVSTTAQPGLYELMLPAIPGLTLSSITLPVMPVNFLTGTHSCTTSANVLHILAIGTRPVSGGQGPAGSAWTGGYAGPMDAAIAPAGGSLSNVTLREVVAVTASGAKVRIELSNAHGEVPVTFDAATIAAQSSGEATAAAPAALTFGGSASVTIPVGGDVYCDPVASPGGTKFVISLHVSATSAETSVPVHETPSSATFYATGNQTANSDGTPFTAANSTLGLYYVSRVDVSDATGTDGTVAVLGDQTAEQAPAGTFGTWAAGLPAALQADGVALPGAVADVASGGAEPAHWWRMNGTGLDTASTAYDGGSAPTASLTLGGTAAWATDIPGTDTTTGSLSLDGTSGFASSSGQVVNMSQSMIVATKARLLSPVDAGGAVGGGVCDHQL